jgi:hypothetical protein
MKQRGANQAAAYTIKGILDGFYQGEMQAGKPHGHGTWVGKGIAAGHRYEGEWTQGEWHGYGICTMQDGAWYKGQFEDHCFHGRGAWRSSDGTRFFDGKWERGWPRHGIALDCRDGSIYLASVDGENWIDSMLKVPGIVPTGWRKVGKLERQPGTCTLEAGLGSVVLLDGTRLDARMGRLHRLSGVASCSTVNTSSDE